MILRQFLSLSQNASPERRAEAARTLTRSYLQGTLGPEAAWETKTALLALLDDPAPSVRRALAEACAGSDQAPRPLIVALAADQPDIAGLVLARSPVLMDADLVDGVAMGCEETRAAIAGRANLSRPVAAALAEVGGAPSVIALARNGSAEIGTAAQLRMIERHGEDAELRHALLARASVPIEVRHAIVALVAEHLSRCGQDAGWIHSERGTRVAREARDAAALALSDEAGEAGLGRLVAHLRAQEQLTAGLILRAILSLRIPFAEVALAELSGLSRARVAGSMLEPDSSGFAALHRRAGLPDLLLPPIRAALTVWRDDARQVAGASAPRLARTMIEAALTACASLPFAQARSLMALLARFESEAARDEARILTHEQAETVQTETLAEASLLAAADTDWDDVLDLADTLAEPAAIPSVDDVAEAAPAPALDAAEPFEGGVVSSEPEEEQDAGPWPLAPRPEDRIGAVVSSLAPTGDALPADEEEIPATAEAVLAGLAEAMRDQFLASRPVAAPVSTAADAVLADLADALMAQFLAERPGEHAASVPAVGPAIVSIEPKPIIEPRPINRPRAIAVAVAAGMIPHELVLSYRADRDRQRLAA